jgi:hypothetical protein
LLAKFNLNGTLDASFGEGGLSTPALSSIQNHWLVSLAVLDDGRIAGLLKSGAGEDLGASELHLLEWAVDGGEPDVHVLEWADAFIPGHLDARGNDVAVVGTVGDVVSLFGPRQIGVASWDGEAAQWHASGTSDSPFLLTGHDVAWAGDSALHVSARMHSDSLATAPLPYALWADSSTYHIHRFVLESVPSSVPTQPTVSLVSGLFHPNPASDEVHWAVPQPVDRITATSPCGSLVYESRQPARLETSFHVQGWSPGIYLLEGWCAGQLVARTKLVVAH